MIFDNCKCNHGVRNISDFLNRLHLTTNWLQTIPLEKYWGEGKTHNPLHNHCLLKHCLAGNFLFVKLKTSHMQLSCQTTNVFSSSASWWNVSILIIIWTCAPEDKFKNNYWRRGGNSFHVVQTIEIMQKQSLCQQLNIPTHSLQTLSQPELVSTNFEPPLPSLVENSSLGGLGARLLLPTVWVLFC